RPARTRPGGETPLELAAEDGCATTTDNFGMHRNRAAAQFRSCDFEDQDYDSPKGDENSTRPLFYDFGDGAFRRLLHDVIRTVSAAKAAAAAATTTSCAPGGL
ncbi:MAG: hypothetical protein HY735_14130, partial [Verrucomicrobia bacterium]|nr:hypothetical protein [Verrucomicrobiota bacterium]